MKYIVKGDTRDTYFTKSDHVKVFEIEIEADNPLEAAAKARRRATQAHKKLACVRQVSGENESSTDDGLDKPWYKSKIVAFDVETTGFHPEKNDILELGISESNFDGDRLTFDNSTSYLFSDADKISDKIQELTGITPDMIAGKPTFGDRGREIKRHLINDVDMLLCHNRGFDSKFLWHAFDKCGMLGHLDRIPPVLCSMELAIHTYHESPDNKLESLAPYFGVDLSNAHRAGADAKATGEVFRHLMALDKDKHDWSARRLVQWSDKPIWVAEGGPYK